MRIDRATFLALCGAIACKVEQQPTMVPTVPISAAASATDAVPIATNDGVPQAVCDDALSKGPSPICEGMQDPDRACAPFDFPRDQCDAFVELLKPRLAQEYVDCMMGLTPEDLCQAMKTYACKDRALRDACPSGDVAAYCAAEGQPTQGEDEGCMLYARGLNDLGRRAASQTCGFTWSCMEGLRSPSAE